jgi:hypothetical protein
MEPEGLLMCSKEPATCPCPKNPSKSEAMCDISQHAHFLLRWSIVQSSANSQAEGTPLVTCQQLFIHYIRNYDSYLLYPQPEDAPCRIELIFRPSHIWPLQEPNITLYARPRLTRSFARNWILCIWSYVWSPSCSGQFTSKQVSDFLH